MFNQPPIRYALMYEIIKTLQADRLQRYSGDSLSYALNPLTSSILDTTINLAKSGSIPTIRALAKTNSSPRPMESVTVVYYQEVFHVRH